MKIEDQPKTITLNCHTCDFPLTYYLQVWDKSGDIHYHTTCPCCREDRDHLVYKKNLSRFEKMKQGMLEEEKKSKSS